MENEAMLIVQYIEGAANHPIYLYEISKAEITITGTYRLDDLAEQLVKISDATLIKDIHIIGNKTVVASIAKDIKELRQSLEIKEHTENEILD